MKSTKVPSLVLIAILTTITIAFWIIFNVYRVFTSRPSPTVQENLIEPLVPTLDTSTLDKIQGSLYFEGDQIPQDLVTIGE